MKSLNDYDSPWKEIIETWFQEFMEFFYPDVAAAIDWERGYEFLDKEFQQVSREAQQGRKLADKLARVWLLTGQEVWVLAHVEVQGGRETDFPKRMYIYNYRIFDYFDRPVVSLALLTDSHKTWRPDSFAMEMLGCQSSFTFVIFKLLDCNEEELEACNSPFALCALAQLKANQTVHSPESRKQWKLRLVRSLYAKGFVKQEIINLFRFIDWVMALPKEFEKSFWQEHSAYEEKRKMQYVTSVERIGIEKGHKEGHRKGQKAGRKEGRKEGHKKGRKEGRKEGLTLGETTVISRQLEQKFGALPDQYLMLLKSADEESLLNWADRILTADSLEEVFF